MSRIGAAGAVFAFVIAGLATGSWAQGLVTMQELSAPLGAIGVSGAPGGQLDDDCARAALAR